MLAQLGGRTVGMFQGIYFSRVSQVCLLLLQLCVCEMNILCCEHSCMSTNKLCFTNHLKICADGTRAWGCSQLYMDL